MVQAQHAAAHPLIIPANHAATCSVHLATMRDSCDCGEAFTEFDRRFPSFATWRKGFIG